MNIYEQPIDKLQLCIVNEKRRLSDIVDTYNKEYDEYARWLNLVEEKKAEREAYFERLTKALSCAQKFIHDCEEQIKKLQNGEVSQSMG